MKKSILVVILGAALTGCDTPEEIDQMKDRYAHEIQENAGLKEKVAELSKEINDLNWKLSECERKPQVHKYQTIKHGSQVWRFDPASGETCLLLAPEKMWDDKDLHDQSCN